MEEIMELINSIEERLPGEYKILEGDEDSIYIVNRETGKHYEIKITECVE